MESTAQRNLAPPEREGVFFTYVAAVGVAAAVVVVPSLPGLVRFLAHPPLTFVLMAAFAMLVDASPVAPVARRVASPIFQSICFTFAILLMWGLAPAILVQTLAVAVVAVRARQRVWRGAFNAAQYALALAAAAAVLRATGELPFAPAGASGWRDALAVLAAAATWFIVNFHLVGVAIWLRFGGSWWRLLAGTVTYEALSTGALLALAPLLVAAARISPVLVPLVLVPLYAVRRMARLSRDQARRARSDPLTGLANRKALMAEVAAQIAAHQPTVSLAGRAQPDRGTGALVPGAHFERFGLLLLDLDRFKQVNDALGHAIGDRLLVAVGRRLADAVPEGGMVARLGGDEFALVAPGLPDAAHARIAAEMVVEALSEPVSLDGLPVDVGGAIGIAVYPDHGRDFETLMRHADIAMYDAKTRGDAIALYAAESDHNTPDRLELLADLRRALERADPLEVAFYYQPQVAVDTGEVVGVEALLRWQHPQRGWVDPEELIRVAEHSGVMRLLTLRVVDDVVAQLAKWQADGLTLRAAINVSVRDLTTGEIVERLAERLTRLGVRPEQILLEITEGALMADPRRVLATLRRLHGLGVGLSLDDFGTGYSSMQHLRRLPLVEVKIDRSFVLGMADDPDDEAIVRSIIDLAGALGLRVVAEGVENEKTFRALADSGCHVAQGWFFARPMPADDLVSWLARYRPPRRVMPSWPPPED